MQPTPPTQPVTATNPSTLDASGSVLPAGRPYYQGQPYYSDQSQYRGQPYYSGQPQYSGAIAGRQQPGSAMPSDPETAAFLQSVRRRQLIWMVVGGVVALAAVIALLIWPDEVKDGVVQGAQALWRLLQLIFGGTTN